MPSLINPQTVVDEGQLADFVIASASEAIHLSAVIPACAVATK
jgi:hypothetical protein